MVQRQVPKPADVFELLQFKKSEFNGRKRRLAAALTIDDLRRIAKRRTPAAAFDYTDGAADGELSLRRARQAFEDIEFHPSILRDVSHVDTTARILGGCSALPFGIAPTGFTRLMQTEGEVAGAGAAGAAGIPFTLSTLGPPPSRRSRRPTPRAQLVPALRDEPARDLLRSGRARRRRRFRHAVLHRRHPGRRCPAAGQAQRLLHPPQISLRTVANAIPRPWWWWDFITTPKLEFASLSSTGGTVGELLNAAMDPSIDFDDLAEIRTIWPHKIAIKGVQNVEDARKLADLGVDAIVLSNHGGRQLDRAPVPFHLLPDVVREVGDDIEVMIDTGIMNGADIVASIAMGAKFTLVGRAYLYGLMAGGRQGVDRMIEILSEEIVRTMKLLQVTTLDELEPKHVTQLSRFSDLRPRGAGERY